MKEIEKQNVGNAGEYYIASRLSAENLIVTITLGRAEKYDILAVTPKDKTIKISVKTRYLRDIKRFPVSQKDEINGTQDFYYAFVRLNEFKAEPDFWIIPSLRVNEILKESSRIYFNIKTKRDGNPHNDVGIRNFWIKPSHSVQELYPENWEEELLLYYKNLDQLKIVD